MCGFYPPDDPGTTPMLEAFELAARFGQGARLVRQFQFEARKEGEPLASLGPKQASVATLWESCRKILTMGG